MDDLGISLNWASKKEHVPNIEWLNRTAKGHVQSSWEDMSFKRISKWMIMNIVPTDIFWLDAFLPSKNGAGLSNTKGPGKLVLGNVMEHKKVLHLHIGEYVPVYQ